MKKTIFVTGVTRMRNGFICFSGLDKQGRFVRPQIQYPERCGIKKEFLYINGNAVIKPLVKVELDFLRPIPKSAFHTEDWEINGNVRPKLIAVPDETEKLHILNKNIEHSLEDALYKQDRSLFILRIKDIPGIHMKISSGELRLYVSFYDESGNYYKLPVTDANFLAFCKYLYLKGLRKEDIIQRIISSLQGKLIFIRIGLTREWQGAMWKQVTGVFSIPDWLGGACFNDWSYDFTDYVDPLTDVFPFA